MLFALRTEDGFDNVVDEGRRRIGIERSGHDIEAYVVQRSLDGVGGDADGVAHGDGMGNDGRVDGLRRGVKTR